MIHIRGQNLSKVYGVGESEVKALDEVSVTIEPGEFVAVMGESGSGKSTLLSMLGTLNSPSSGALYLDDRDVYALSQDARADLRRAAIGFVFQNFHLIPYLTLAENVMVPLATEKRPRGEKIRMAEEALAQVGLDGKAGRLPGQISGGEQERVAIARAIVNRPSIILADEPTGNLDSRNAREIMGLLGELNSHGRTILMVTHSNEYAGFARRLLRLTDGRLDS